MADRNLDAEITVEFNEAASRQSLNSGDSINTLFGKIKKFFSDLKPVAFSGDAETVSGHTVAADVPALGYYYATCSTGLEKNIKEVTCEGFEIKEGARITICFTAGNGGTPPNATYILKINDDAGRPIAYNDWQGDGVVNMLTAKTSELCCGNQTWDFVFYSGRFLMTTFLGNYIIDDALNKNSMRCVQNKVIKAALDEKANVDDIPDLSPYAKTADVPEIKVNNAVNADTLSEKSYDEIKNTSGVNLLTSPETATDIRSWIYNFDSGLYVISYNQTNLILPDDVSSGEIDSYFFLDWKRRYSNDLGGYDCQYGVLNLYSMQKNAIKYQSIIHNDKVATEWVKIISSEDVFIINAVNINVSREPNNYDEGKSFKRVCRVDTTPGSTNFQLAGFWVKNTSNKTIKFCINHQSSSASPILQGGYGTGSFSEMFLTGTNREWYSNVNIDKTVNNSMILEIPAGRIGYFGFNKTSSDNYAIIDGIEVISDKIF